MSLRSAVRTSAHSEARCRFPAYSANNTMLRCAYIHQAELSQQKPSTNLRQAIQSQGSSEDMQANAKPTVWNKLMLATPKIKTKQPEQSAAFKTNQPQQRQTLRQIIPHRSEHGTQATHTDPCEKAWVCMRPRLKIKDVALKIKDELLKGQSLIWKTKSLRPKTKDWRPET